MVGAVLIAVLAFVLLQPEDEDSSERSGQTTQQADTTTAPDQTTTDQTTAPEETTTEQTPEAQPQEPEVQVVRVRDGEPVDGLAEIEAEEGETVRFQVIADDSHELHLHGYDITENVTAKRPANFSFKADETGIFELEIHGPGTQIAELKVEP